MDAKTRRDRLWRRSKLLLGGKHQAEVGAAIDEAGELIWGRALLEALELEETAKGMISAELRRLQKAGLVVPATIDEYDRRKPLKRVDPDDPYWALCRQLRDNPI